MNKEKKRTGRPPTPLDYDLIGKLTAIHCTQAEIATILGVNVKTLTRKKDFRDIYKKGIDTAKASLRRLQWKSAEGEPFVYLKDEDGKMVLDKNKKPVIMEGRAPNITAQIWLGKQYLDQKDRIEGQVPLAGRPIKVITAVPRPNGHEPDDRLNETVPAGTEAKASP